MYGTMWYTQIQLEKSQDELIAGIIWGKNQYYSVRKGQCRNADFNFQAQFSLETGPVRIERAGNRSTSVQRIHWVSFPGVTCWLLGIQIFTPLP